MIGWFAIFCIFISGIVIGLFAGLWLSTDVKCYGNVDDELEIKMHNKKSKTEIDPYGRDLNGES